MNSELIRQREKFKKRALEMPTVEKRVKSEGVSSSFHSSSASSSSANRSSSRFQFPGSSSGQPFAAFDYKTATGSSQIKFAVLKRIVTFMRKRHQNGDNFPLSITHILEESGQIDVSSRIRQWLASEVLPVNRKLNRVLPDGRPVEESVSFSESDMYIYKPTYDVSDKKALQELLTKYEVEGLGGILLEDVLESLPCEKPELVFKSLADEVISVTRAYDKKVVIFSKNKDFLFDVNEEFRQMWRSIAVDTLDDRQIEQYLKGHGINSMYDNGPRQVFTPKRKVSKVNRRRKNIRRDNEHVSGILEEYSNSNALGMNRGAS